LGLIIFSRFGVLSPAIAYLFSAIIGFILLLFLFFKTFKYFKYESDFSNKLKLRIFKYGVPLLLASIGFTIIGQIDTLMLIKFRSLSEVGVYNAVLPTAMLLITLGSSLALAILPLVSEFWVSKKFKELSKIIEIVYKNSFLIIVPLVLFVFVFSDLILKVLFGDSFLSGLTAIRILLVGSILYSVALINNSILPAIGKPREVTKVVLIAVIFNILLNLILIPKIGINGAAIATTLAYSIVLIISSYKIMKIMKIKLPIKNWIKTFFVGFLFMVSVWLIKDLLNINLYLEFLISLICGSLFYLILITTFKIVKKDEIKFIIQSLFKKN
jgi:stage V sporulation protein B